MCRTWTMPRSGGFAPIRALVRHNDPVESLRHPPIGFAHRGARALAPDNTMESFALAVEMGATALESDVWLTSDGVAVLDHDGVVRLGGRQRSIADVPRASLPAHIPALSTLFATLGTDLELSLDIKDPAAGPATIALARDVGAEDRLWLCHHDVEVVAGWRSLSDAAHLVDSTRLRRIKEGVERRAARHRSAGIDAVNMHASDWTRGLVTLWHRFERLAFGWDAQQPRVLATLLGMGIDGVYSDYVDRMLAALAEAAP
jgi:glycerophosphoryl diester phosphodiesterase